MTLNQLRFQELQETKRSHSADELERNRHNVATESQEKAKLAETVRNNNLINALGRDTLGESARHNRTVEGETHRSNVTREKETERHNRAQVVSNEKIAGMKAISDTVGNIIKVVKPFG